ncbi:Beta-lactamase/transpeptidase-like protein [Elaphomyces granulatus]
MKLLYTIWVFTAILSPIRAQVNSWEAQHRLDSNQYQTPSDDHVSIPSIRAQVNPWEARYGLDSNQYQTLFNDLVSKGYRLNWVSGYTFNNEPRFASIFEKKSSPAWVSHHGMNSTQYQQNFDTYVGQGYRLVLVNGYEVQGVDNYVAIWDKSPSGQWVARHGMSPSDYQDAFDTYVGQGYRLRHVSGYAVGNEARYAAIWEKTNDGIAWVARHGMTSSDYQNAFDGYVSQGYRLVVVNGYQVNNVDYYAAIWDKSTSGPWIARHGMTSSQFQAEFDNNYYQGFVLQVVSGYDLGQTDVYAALWVNPVMNGSDLDTINNNIQSYMDQNSVPGLSLAITQDDRLVFAKGFGFADKASSTIVTPKSMFRIMSISKSLTATAIMLLRAQGRLKLSDRIFGPGSLTSDKYGNLLPIVNGLRQYKPGVTSITVQNLLEHQAGWGDNADPEVFLRTMSPAEAVSKTLATVPLQYQPNQGHKYSNFGFLILGRLISDLGGVSYESYVAQHVLAPSGVTKMQLANDGGPIDNEVTYYPLGVTNGWRIHEFDSFGGWVATAIDVCRFSTHVDGISTKPDILSPSIESEMWQASSLDNGYAKGWIVNQPLNNWRGHNGGFGGTGAFFTQRTDNSKIGFMVVMNTNPQLDGTSWNLRALVDGMISKVGAWPSYDLF